MVCAFTGHRPHRLPWGENEADPRCEALKILLDREVSRAADEGCTEFLCGMARGCDFYFAEAVLKLKQERPELILEAVLPCPEQADQWPEADRSRYRSILLRCDRLTVLESGYRDGCMLRRNRAMVDRCDRLISVYDGGSGGTQSTVAYAARKGITIRPLWA